MFKIGNVEIKNQVVMAPMAGITNLAFRKIVKEFGAGLVYSEMVSDKAICYGNKKTLEMLKVDAAEHPVSIQLFGGEVETMVKAAKYIDEHSDCDIIDINCGCPVNKVLKANAGSQLLKDPQLIYDIVSGIVKNVKKPVTVKIRSGFDKEHINAVENARLIEKAGAKAITIHGRTRSQFYSGKANYNIIKDVVDAVNIPVIGNGDVVDIDSAKLMFETGCQAIAIGRGSLGNPFIFRELVNYFDNNKIIAKPTKKEIYDTIIKQHNLLLNLKGERLANLEMRSHIAWYIKGMPNSARIKEMVFKENNFLKVKEIIYKYLLEGDV